MYRKMIALLTALAISFAFLGSVHALTITPDERILPYAKGETIEIAVYVKVETEAETGKYKLEVEDKPRFNWVDDDNESETIDVVGEERRLVVEVEAENATDGKYIFQYTVYNASEEKVHSGNYEVEIGKGGSEGACNAVLFGAAFVGLVGLVGMVAIVRK